MNSKDQASFIKDKFTIKEATKDQLSEVLHVEREAFGGEEEAELVDNLLVDNTAFPLLSLLAWQKGKAVGHILFTKCSIKNDNNFSCYMLAPLAVLPEYQGLGVGKALMDAGHKILKSWGVDIVFVLGHSRYYPKRGYINDAGKAGFAAPYPILPKNVNAWMYQYLSEKRMENPNVAIRCCKAMDKQEYWEE